MPDTAASILFGKTRQAVLALLFTHPELDFYLRELGRLTGISAGSLQHELDRLLRADLVTRAKSGNRVHYRANQLHPIFSELRAIVEKTSGVPEMIRQALAPLGSDIAFACIYGSTAKGTSRARSDVDLLVVGAIDMAMLVDRLAPVEERLGREINARVFSLDEFTGKLKAKDRFLSALVQGSKTIVMGNIHEPG